MIEHKQGTTYNGRTFNFLVNSVPLDLTDTDIIITFSYDCSRNENKAKTGTKTHILTIGDGVSDVNALNGEFVMLKDTLIDWAIGIWDYEVKFVFPDNAVKIWYTDTLWIQS